MGKSIEIQTKGEMEIIHNRKAKMDTEERLTDLEKQILYLTKIVEENK